MTKITTTVIATFLLLCSYSFSNAQDSFSESPNTPAIAGPVNEGQNLVGEVILGQGLIFFNDAGAFLEICNNLAFEDFEDTNLGPNSVLACPGSFNSMTNNACYSSGALLPGFSLSSTNNFGPGDPVVLTPNFNGVTNVAVGPNTFSENTIITFDPPVTGVGLSILTPLSAAMIDVNVFGPGNALLGTATLNLPGGPVADFLGIRSGAPITRIELDDNFGGAELLYDLYFGQCGLVSNVPTLSEWGLIAMAGILGIVGFMVMRRRKVTA